MDIDLQQLFKGLVLPLSQPSAHTFRAVGIPDFEEHRLAKDANGSPCILLYQEAAPAAMAPVLLENLSVTYGVSCSIAHPDGELEEGIFTIIRCSAADPSLFPHFLRILSPIVVSLGRKPSSAAVKRAIFGLVDLFRTLTAPARKSLQGLWAELFLMSRATDQLTVIEAWHHDPTEHIDFVQKRQRIEVKSSSTRHRIHFFSLLQLTPPADTSVLVASLFVERAGGGLSLRQLYEDVRAKIPTPESLVRFDATFFGTLGLSWIDAMNEAFDSELASESLQFYDVMQIPKVQIPVPAGVGDVRFTSDLSIISPLSSSDLQKAGGLFQASLPRRR